MSDAKNDKTPSKAAANDDASKVKLLVSCIKHKNGDGINWQLVAEECEVLGTDGKPSKGAASKRYERILKSFGVEKPAVGKASGENGSSTPKKNATPRTNKAAKQDTNTEEGEDSPSKKRKKSPAPAAVKEDSPIKFDVTADELDVI